MKPINIVVTCTKRKRLPPADGLEMRGIDARDVDSTFAEWSSRLELCTAEPIPARRLYAGDHWSVVQSLEDVAAASKLDIGAAIGNRMGIAPGAARSTIP